MATTYVSSNDLDFLLGGFVERYYGTHIDDSETISLIQQYYEDMNRSYDETNERLWGINHLKSVPVATQSGGNYPMAIRKLQGNLMIYQRLLGAHYGEFTDGIPGWINVYLRRAEEIESDIRAQKLVFQDDVTQGESGIGIGTWVTKVGAANLYTNWEVGSFTYDAYPKTYRVSIDGTASGNGIGTATFKWSDNNGQTYATTGVTTATHWLDLEHGLRIRWEAVGTGVQLELNDTFSVKCTPPNITTKGGGIRTVTFKRG